MAVFGNYETVRELKRTGLGAVWLAKPAGTPAAPATHIIKIREPLSELIGRERSDRALAQFLESAQIQQSVPAHQAAGGPALRSLAPIVAMGRQDSKAYVIAEYCPRSLLSVAGRVRVDGVVMRKVAQAVTTAVRQLLATGRVHGNLKPTNILFTGEGELAEASVRVDDPASVAGGSAQDVQNELRDLAQLLVQLATGKPYDQMRGWPIQTSPEWQKLGEDETVWRRLCHDILNPNPEARPSLEQVEARIAEGEAGVQANLAAMQAAGGMVGVGFEVAPEAPRKSRKPWYIGGAVAASLIGYGVYTVFFAEKEDTGPRQGIKVTRDPEVPKLAPELMPAEGDDPRLAWTADATIAQLKPDLDALSNPGSAEKAPELAPQRDKIVADVTAILADRATIETDLAKLKEIKWIVRDADEVRTRKDAIDQKLGEIAQRVTDVRTRAKDYEDALRLEVRKTDSLDGFQEYVRSRKTAGGGFGPSVKPYFGEACDELIAMQGDLNQLNDLFKQLTKGLQALEDQINAQKPKGTRPLDKALASKLELIARDALHELKPLQGGKWLGEDAAFRQGWDQRLGAFASAAKDLITVAEKSTKLLKKLDEGWMLAEDPGDGSIAAEWTPIENTPAAAEFTTGELKPHGGDVLKVKTRIDAMRQILAATDADVLDNAISNPEVSVGEARCAWVRLGEVAPPAEARSVERHIRLAERVESIVKSRATPAKREPWENDVAEQLRQRWGSAMGKVADRESVAAVLALRDAAGATEEFAAGLPAYTRYNIALSTLDSARAKLVKGGQSKQLKKATQKFADAVKTLGSDIASRPDVARVLSGIGSALAQKSSITEDDLKEMGPGVRGWRVAIAGEEAERVAYTQPIGRNAQVLEFRQIKNEDAGWVAYLQTTELTVSEFNAITQGDKWPEVRALLPENPLRLGGGPATWTARRGPRGGVSASQQFLAANPQMQPAAPYPKDLQVGTPNGEMPMQQVSPDSALIAARLVGCRLPSVEEWNAALTYEGGISEASKGANLRDLTWKKQWAYIASDQVPQSGKAAAWPDRGVFFSPDGGQRSRDQDAKPAVDTDDGVLWFRAAKTGPGREFKNLIGNVSELVTSDPGPFEEVKVDHNAVFTALGNYELVRVVGGSSLSESAMTPAKAWTVDPEEAKRGFADVGFRLAFTAGPIGPPFAQILGESIGTPVYLRP